MGAGREKRISPGGGDPLPGRCIGGGITPCLYRPLFSRRNPARKRSPLSTTPPFQHLFSHARQNTRAPSSAIQPQLENASHLPVNAIAETHRPSLTRRRGIQYNPLSPDHCCRKTAVFEEEFGVCCGAPRAIAANKKRLPPTTQRTFRPWAGSRSRPEGTTIRSAPRASAAPGSTRRLEGKPLCLLQRSDIAAKAARLQPSTPARGCLPLQRRHDRPDHRRLPITLSVC